jgi:hypothetical protein
MSGQEMAIAVGAGAGLIIGLILRVLNSRSSRQLSRAKREFLNVIRKRIPSAKMFIVGGTNAHPVVWTTTPSDIERDQLREDESLRDRFRTLLLQAEYAAGDIPLVQFVYESQETVDREFKGSWNQRKYVWLRERY